MHLKHDPRMLEVLDRAGVPFVYKILVANTEGCAGYLNVRQERFLQICHYSQDRIGQSLQDMQPSFRGRLQVGNFIGEFGGRFFGARNRFAADLEDYHRVSGSEDQRFQRDIKTKVRARTAGGSLRVPEKYQRELMEVIRQRILLDMSDYMAFGLLAMQSSQFSVIINHRTSMVDYFI